MTWKYYIVKSDLGYYLKKRKDGMIYFLSKNQNRVSNKESAMTFYHLEEAKSALVLMRIKDEGKKSH